MDLSIDQSWPSSGNPTAWHLLNRSLKTSWHAGYQQLLNEPLRKPQSLDEGIATIIAAAIPLWLPSTQPNTRSFFWLSVLFICHKNLKKNAFWGDSLIQNHHLYKFISNFRQFGPAKKPLKNGSKKLIETARTAEMSAPRRDSLGGPDDMTEVGTEPCCCPPTGCCLCLCDLWRHGYRVYSIPGDIFTNYTSTSFL